MHQPKAIATLAVHMRIGNSDHCRRRDHGINGTTATL
jgi:hypothetical protein